MRIALSFDTTKEKHRKKGNRFMQEISFFLHCIPVGKGRPKFARRGNFVQTYTPEKTVIAERTIAFAVHEIMKEKQITEILTGPLECEIICYLPRSKSSNKRIYPAIKPDCDNLFKLSADTMNSLIYKDDCQIVDGICRKRYPSSSQPNVGIQINIKQLLTYEENEGKKCKATIKKSLKQQI